MDQANFSQSQGQNQPASGFPAGGFSPPASAVGSSTSVFTPSAGAKKSAAGKNIIIVGILVLLLAGLILGFDKARSFLSKAEGSCSPENLAEANLTPNSVEIVFQTGKSCQMEVAYGTSSESLLLQVPESMASLNHRIRLSPLLPSTTYYYQLVTEGKKVGQVRSFLTKAATPTVIPTMPPAQSPTSPPGAGTTKPGGTYTLNDFEPRFGTANPTFDIDKNGVVNIRDWLLYQKTQVE